MSGKDAPDDLGFDDAGELVLQATVEVRQVSGIKSHEVQDGGVEVAKVVWMDRRLLAEFVGRRVPCRIQNPVPPATTTGQAR